VGSKFAGTGAAAAGSFYYTVAAFNDSGESKATVTATATTTLANSGSVTITLPVAPATTTGWRIYRGLVSDGSDAKWIVDTAVANATYVDLNTKIPGTGYVFVYNRNPSTMTVAQLTPLIRYPLAIVTTTVEWLLLLYFVPILKAGERIFIWENVGRL
jgi:heme/copper-type cytochrome/quinol oxidase subunit 1